MVMIKLQKAAPFRMSEQPVAVVVEHLLAQFTGLWWRTGTDFPDLGRTYPLREQIGKEKEVEGFVDTLIREVKTFSPRPASGPGNASASLRQRLAGPGAVLARSVLGLEERHVDLILTQGFLEQAEAFAHMARQFDPAVTADDIYQASRNVWTMNFFQLLLGLPVQITPAVFAFSMLYPDSDNYLDDPAVPIETKLSFNDRFRRRINGEGVEAANHHEAAISELVSMIEAQYDRAQHPQVYESLAALHLAQTKSITLLAGQPRAYRSPYEVDVLGICFEKGGTSGLADGYLVAGSLTEQQQAFTFFYGIYTQLIDDLEDVDSDLQAGLATVFSGTARHWRLDALTNRTMRLGEELVRQMEIFPSPTREPFAEMIQRCLPVLIITSVGGARSYFPPAYVREMEKHLPVRLSFLDRQQKKMEKSKISLGRLLELF